jgi:hypothetical protein
MLHLLLGTGIANTESVCCVSYIAVAFLVVARCPESVPFHHNTTQLNQIQDTDTMHLQNLLWTVWFWQFAASLIIPQHAAQSPMLPKQQTTRPTTTSVILAFTSDNSDRIHRVEVTSQDQTPSGKSNMEYYLRTHLTPGSGIDLPTHPHTIKIEAAMNQRRQSVSLEDLSQIMCRVISRLSAEEKATYHSSGREKVWPWFKVGDDTVQFEDTSSRWFLAGRAVESYECR